MAHNDTSTQTTIIDLTEGAFYQVGVRAGNEQGNGPWSQPAATEPSAPDAPDTPTVTPFSTTKLKVSWNIPNDNGEPVTGYDVRYRRVGTSTWRNVAHSGTDTEAQITGVSLDITYEVQVKASNIAGAGPWSGSGNGTPALPGQTETPTVTPISGTELKVDWNAPADNGNPITSYEIRYREKNQGDGTWQGWEHNDASTRTIIKRLSKNTVYEVAILAANGTGSANFWSDPGKGEIRAPGRPDKPRVSTASTTSLSVGWNEPENYGLAIKSYKIRYRQNSDPYWLSWPHGNTQTGTRITNLAQDRKHEVQTQASNAAGNSEWSASGEGTPKIILAKNGDLRLVDDAGATNSGQGRLEVFYRREWGTVCDDRFTSRFYDHSNEQLDEDGNRLKVDNIAPQLACQLMGHGTGEMVSRSSLGMNLALRAQKIWLDDVRCAEGSMHWTGSPPTGLQHCYHGGWALHNCTLAGGKPNHDEDVHLRCTGSSTAQAPLTSEFQGVPESHDGTEFTFQVAFSEAVTASAEDLRDHAFGVTGGSITQISAVDGRQDLWTVTVAPTANEDITIELEAERACDVAGAICTEDGERLANTVSVEIAAAQSPPVELTARLDATPASHDGEMAFTFRLSLSDDIANSDADVRDNAFEVSGGNVTDASRVDGRSDLWEITITPDGTGNVTIVLAANRECTTAGALCTADGRTLTTPLLVSIATLRDDDDTGGPEPGAPLTARFVDMPAEHDGRKGFGFQLVFSEEVFDGTEQLDKNKAVRNALNITGGSAKGSRRVNASQFDAYWIRIRPSGNGPVTIRLAPPGTCTDSSPTCTPDGRKLSGPISATIEGPPGISITDATVEEAHGAVLEFGIALSRAASHQVTVDYATSDGTAQAGADYTATSGTVTFVAGEIKKTIDVTVLDDAHDEGSETLTLVLSNPSGAYLADGEATGTIENTDHMPQAWLGRFGRTVAEQVLDAVEERIRAAPQAGVQVTVAGQRIGAAAAPDADALEEAEAQARLEDFSTWLRGEACRDDPGTGGGLPGADAVAGGGAARAADGLLVRADDRGGGDRRRSGLAVGPGRGLELRRARGRPLAVGRGDRRAARGGLDPGALDDGPDAVARPRRGQLPGGGQRPGLLDGDRALSLRALCRDRPCDGVGRGGLRRGHADADAGGRRVDIRGRHGPRDGGGGSARGGGRGAAGRRAGACGEDRRDGGPDLLGGDRRQRGRQPRGGGGRRDAAAARAGGDVAGS